MISEKKIFSVVHVFIQSKMRHGTNIFFSSLHCLPTLHKICEYFYKIYMLFAKEGASAVELIHIMRSVIADKRWKSLFSFLRSLEILQKMSKFLKENLWKSKENL